jgi:hypothetical protein
MLTVLQVIAVFMAAVAMALALAHALELPGKLRLDQETYRAVQTIYYPGFTIGGASEVLAILATLALLLVSARDGGVSAWIPAWILAGLAALLAMHATYWIFTHPVNKFWLEGQDLKGLGKGFFGFDPLPLGRASDGDAAWQQLRDRWEYSHVARAILGAVALIALASSLATS